MRRRPLHGGSSSCRPSWQPQAPRNHEDCTGQIDLPTPHDGASRQRAPPRPRCNAPRPHRSNPASAHPRVHADGDCAAAHRRQVRLPLGAGRCRLAAQRGQHLDSVVQRLLSTPPGPDLRQGSRRPPAGGSTRNADALPQISHRLRASDRLRRPGLSGREPLSRERPHPAPRSPARPRPRRRRSRRRRPRRRR